jgi:hypothetical protein
MILDTIKNKFLFGKWKRLQRKTVPPEQNGTKLLGLARYSKSDV